MSYKAKTGSLLQRKLFLAFLILAALNLTVSRFAEAQTTTINVNPSSVSAFVGQDFTINIMISNVLDLCAWEFKINWTADLLSLSAVVEGQFLKAGGDTFFSYQALALGCVIVDCTLLGFQLGVSGDGTLATITFYVNSSGECPLDVYDVLLLNSFEQVIPYEAVDGYGYFAMPHDIAVTDVLASPLTVVSNDTVIVNVTVENQGGYPEDFDVTAYANSLALGTQHMLLENGSAITIPFTWDTTGFPKGDYLVSAQASVVTGEEDVADNTKGSSDNVTVLTADHDITVTGVNPSKTAVGQGYCLNVSLVVKNYGIFDENLNVSAFVNTTDMQTYSIYLESGKSIVLVLTWNTSTFDKGNYSTSGKADAVLGETYVVDNVCEGSWVFVTIAGDINADRLVNAKDAIKLGSAFGSYYGDPTFDSNADINGDNYCNAKDSIIIGNHFNETW